MNLNALQTFLEHNVLVVALVMIGVVILFRAHAQDHKGAVTSLAVVLIGLLVIGLGVSGASTQVSSDLVHLVIG